MTKQIHRNQQGFAIGTVVLVVILATAVFGIVKFISAVQADNREQGSKLQASFNDGYTTPDEAAKTGSDPDETTETPGQTAKEYEVRSVKVKIDPLTVTISIGLPLRIEKGTCYVDLRLPDGSNYVRYVEPVEKSNSCVISVPVKKLEASKTWTYQAGFFSSDAKLKGEHEKSQLNL